MLNIVTLRKSAKQTKVDLKTVFRVCYCFFVYLVDSQHKCSNSIIEANETFSLNSLNRSILFHIGIAKNVREEELKGKNKLRSLITRD